MEFKGTKEELELQYVSGVCIGIGTIGSYSQITANSILPDTDEEYAKEKTEIEANMKLYAASFEMMNILEYLLEHDDGNGICLGYNSREMIESILKKVRG